MKKWIVVLVAAWAIIFSLAGYWLSREDNFEEITAFGDGIGRLIMGLPPSEDPRYRPPSYNPAANQHKEKGDEWMESKEYGKAIDEYTLAIKFDPDYSAAYLSRGNAWAEKGLYHSAQMDYTKCIELNPKDFIAISNRGLLHVYQKNWAKALADFNKTLEIKPYHKNAFIGKGVASENLEKYSEAIANYRQAIERYPDEPERYNNLAWVLATCPIDKYRNGKKALELASKALSQKRNPYFLRSLAAAHAEIGQFEKAVQTQEDAIDLAKKTGVHDLSDFIKELDSYDAGKPWRDE